MRQATRFSAHDETTEETIVSTHYPELETSSVDYGNVETISVSPKSTVDTPPPATRPFHGSIGDYLKTTREQQGLTVAEVARELYLEPHIVIALESEAKDKLPPVIFVQGYLRSYAKLLKLDAESLVKKYMSEQQTNAFMPKLSYPSVNPRQVGVKSPLIRLQTALLLIILLLLMVLWRQTALRQEPIELPAVVKLTDSPESTVSPPLLELPPQGFTPPMEGGEEEPAGSANDQNPPTEQATPSNETAVSGDNADPATEATQAPAPEVTRQVYLRFKSRCWASVKDATGKTFFSKTGSAQEELIITNEGTPPFRFVFGNPNGVEILEVMGEKHDFSDYKGAIPAKLTFGEKPN